MHSTGSRLSLRFFVLPATPLPFFRNSILYTNEIRVALFSLKCKRKGSYGLFICLLSLLFFKQKNIKMRVKERTCYK